MAFLLTRRPLHRSLLASRTMGTISNYQNDGNDRRFHPVYVHHLSKVALEHLQKQQYEFVAQHKLDTGLRFNPDGTFVIHFQSHDGRIWTSYNGERKEHWLSVFQKRLVSSFLLKDTSMTGYTDEAINDNVRACIDHMIKKLKETEIED